MERTVIIAAAVVVLVVIIGFLYFNPLGKPPTSTITLLTTIAPSSTTTVNHTGSSTTSTATTSVFINTCVSQFSRVAINNGNFSTGTFAGWNSTGTGFTNAPRSISYLNSNYGYLNHTWYGYNGTYFASTTNGAVGVQPGNLTSNPFLVVLPYLNFRIVSPASGQLYVEILRNGKPIIITYYNTYNAPNNPYPTSHFVNASIPLTFAFCQNVSVRAVAQVVGTPQNRIFYIAIGDFYLSRNPIQDPNIVVNQTIYTS